MNFGGAQKFADACPREGSRERGARGCPIPFDILLSGEKELRGQLVLSLLPFNFNYICAVDMWAVHVYKFLRV